MSILVEDIQRHIKNGLFKQNVYRQREITGNMFKPRRMLKEYSPRFIFVRLVFFNAKIYLVFVFLQQS
jgi:hypothetical protein